VLRDGLLALDGMCRTTAPVEEADLRLTIQTVAGALLVRA